MKIKTFIGTVLYPSLIIGGLLFVRQTVIDFQAGKTFYSDTQLPLSLNDLPTVIVCWELEQSMARI